MEPKQPIVDVDKEGALQKVFDTINWMFTSKMGITIVSSLLFALLVIKVWKAIPKGVLLVVAILLLIGVGVLKTNIGR